MFLSYLALLSWIVIEVICEGCEENSVRLVNGSSRLEGRVEICRGHPIRTWGTVCDDFWDWRDASVVCRQLGFSSQGSISYKQAHFGQGTGETHLDNVHCMGNEQSLSSCPSSDRHNCHHREDAGVRCEGIIIVDAISNVTSVLVSWRSNPVVSNVSIIISQPLNNSRNQMFGTITEVPDGETNFTCVNLRPQQNYSVCVVLFLGQQYTLSSCRIIQTRAAPSPPSPTSASPTSPPDQASRSTSPSSPTNPDQTLKPTFPGPTSQTTGLTSNTCLPCPESAMERASEGNSANCSLLGGVLGSIIALLVLLLIVAGVGLAYPHCIRSRVKNRQLELTSNISYTDRSQHSTGDSAGIYVTPSYEAVPDPPRGPRTGDTAEERYEMPQITPGEPRHGPSISQVTADIVAQHYEMYEATHPEHSAEPAVYEVPVNERGDSKQPAGDYSRLQYQ